LNPFKLKITNRIRELPAKTLNKKIPHLLPFKKENNSFMIGVVSTVNSSQRNQVKIEDT